MSATYLGKLILSKLNLHPVLSCIYQCDVDVIGSTSLLNEVELLQIIDNVFERLNDRDFITNTTILSGDIGTREDSTDNCYHIFYHPE